MAVTFNPMGWKRPAENYRIFAEGIVAAGIPLMVLNIGFGESQTVVRNRSYDYQANTCQLLSGHSTCNGVTTFTANATLDKHLLWQKEAGLNELFRRVMLAFPGRFDAVAWIDADIEFSDQSWPMMTLEALRQHRVVQLFETFERRGPDHKSVEFSFGGAAHCWLNNGQDRGLNPGGAWATSVDTFKEMHGLFARNFFGGGDDTCFCSWVGKHCRTPLVCGLDKLYKKWLGHSYFAVRRSVGYLSGVTAVHRYHGSIANRRFNKRWEDPTILAIDAGKDLEIDSQGLLSWVGKADPKKLDAVRAYFASREEDT
jgi:hypothetical protein